MAPLLAFLVLAPLLARASIAESWYLLRGRSNMKIGNYRAAVEAFAKAVELDPGDREAARSLGLAYELNGETDKSIAAFDRYLARFPDDADVAFKQARTLGWSRYAYRRSDAIRYYRLGLARSEDPARRHELARLLSRDKSTLDEAVQQYRALLGRDPENTAWRAEYRHLLLWDGRYRDEAIAELSREAERRPDDLDLSLTLARLLAKDPRRAAEAAERYRRIVDRRPDDAPLRIEYARVLARRRATRGEAAEQYRRALENRAPAEARLEYAEVLSADAATRPAALSRYDALVREAPGSVRARLGYARLLGERKETNLAAIAQYEAILAHDPGNAVAHRGLAAAYAWEGDSDRALAHAAQALQREPGREDVLALERKLRVGREPELGTAERLFTQGGDAYGLAGIAGGATARSDITPFATTWVEGGLEAVRVDGASASGGFFTLRAQVRPSPRSRAEAQVGYEAMRLANPLAVRLQWQQDGTALSVRPRFERRARTDSFIALVGAADVQGRVIGAATENLFALELTAPLGSARLEAAPMAGWIEAASGDPNGVAGVMARVELPLVAGDWALSGAWEANVIHYQSDYSGFAESLIEPYAGGYFSPRLFVEQSPRLALSRETPFLRLEAAAGPAVQWVVRTGTPGALHLGGGGRLSISQRLGAHLRWSAGARFARVGDVYSRFDAEAALALLF